MRVNYLPNEVYFCNCNGKEYTREEIKTDWNCPDCNEYIHIQSTDTEYKITGVFIRKKAKDICINDIVRPDCHRIDDCYEVLGTHVLKGKKAGKVGIGLKEFRMIELLPEQYISCKI